MGFLTTFYLHRALHFALNELGLVMTAFPLAVLVIALFSGSLSEYIGTRCLACLSASTCALALFFMSQS